MKQSIVEKIKTAPRCPGVYIFRSPRNVLYVGKAVNLRNRLKSYLAITDIKTQSLDQEAERLDYITLRSEIEALIEESRLIKKLKPKYNVLWRDDKSYLYVALTRLPAGRQGQSFPKVFITHQNLKIERIGPFTDGKALRLVMKILRKHYPYCTCPKPHLRDCINAQIGRCLGICCQRDANLQMHADAVNTYKRNIRAIKTILRGQNKKLLKTLTNDKEREALETIFRHKEFLQNHDSSEFPEGYRAECYDMSNFAGKEAVGAMTVLVKKDGAWMPDKNSYRKFKIKSLPAGRQERRGLDDPRAIAEILSRRLNHPEWPYPDLIIIDGGLTQYRAALRVAAQYPAASKIKIISFAKPEQKIIGENNPSEELRKLVEEAIYRTHHFVIRYHRNVRRRELFDIIK
ncbi:MAG: Excinuclease ABC, C subunit domain protein [Parcubacteria group bacterium GW2011_GWA1_48_11b]|nr:MAG: Excinuclease ABC, C subunit domain protein [Parcubacteria group bacterium GW2011_GWA1_48_11b]